jgi:single-strand DNA-binding protein
MSQGDTTITVVGNLTRDPDLRYTSAGVAVCSFQVASTPRTYKDGEWRDGDTLFMACSAWKQVAENCAATLAKGMRVIVVGRLQQRAYEDRNTGQKRVVLEVQADEVGPSLRNAEAKVSKTTRTKASQPAGRPRADDPWASSLADESSQWSDEPPF